MLDSQKAKLLIYTQRKNIEISGIYEDAGYPGNTLECPALQHLMRDAESDEIDAVLVVNRSRLFRGRMPQRLRALELKIQSISEHEYNKEL
ncbi:MAG: recombinase family protein [Oscillospiraceae bacterium]